MNKPVAVEKKNKKDKPQQEEQEKDVSAEEKFEKKKKDSRKSNLKFIIFTAVLVIIFLGIVLVPALIRKINFENNKYNGFDFIKHSDGFWYTKVQKGDQPYWIPFYYHPKELEDIPIDANLRGKFFEVRDNNGRIFITLDPDAENNTIIIAGVEIARITGDKYQLLNVPTHSAFIKPPKNTNVETGTPIITCKDSSNQTLVIWLTLSDKNIAYSYDYCIILEAKSYNDMVRVADRTMYNLLGIMN
ncbi:hypothetical protein JW756_05470 [Candidatus Woesearchaeota archaeon]|nr:hypothetical protein [Candidatus Woesearchaeota archaeon]